MSEEVTFKKVGHHKKPSSSYHFELQDETNKVMDVLVEESADGEAACPAHARFREYLKKHPKGDHHESAPGFLQVSKTGVIYVMARAREHGYVHGHAEWANLGQGAPETGVIEGQPERTLKVDLDPDNTEYAPVVGRTDLREAIANLYNVRYRQGLESQYTKENVCIVAGGRSGLTRLAACIGNVHVGHALPDYTAYEAMLSVFKSFVPIPHAATRASRHRFTPADLKEEIIGRGLSVMLTSNPANPTGVLIQGEELKAWVDIARNHHCSLVMDEFYSHYVYTEKPEDQDGRSVSAAEYVKDVNSDPVIIVDGMTKNFRLPGWRVCWIVGPQDVISTVASAGSFLDGGAPHPLQQAVLPLLDPTFVQLDAIALQKHFRAKRDFLVGKLKGLGIQIDHEPQGTFYIWANLSKLVHPLNNGISFFEHALLWRTIVVPGIFFDVNPSHRRELFYSSYHHFARFSFGPPMETLQRGAKQLEDMVAHYTAHPSNPDLTGLRV